MQRRKEGFILAALVAVAAAFRFTRIGHQSFWLDESYTVDLVQRSFGHMLSGVASDESTPPLYYVLAWVWAKVFGLNEYGLRSLSALAGTLTVPAAYVAGASLVTRRVGLVAAALAAFSPLLVWYSQEARSYALMVLLSGLGLLALLAARERPTARNLALWAAASIAAIATHYYAGFLVGVEALWLLAAAAARLRALVAVAVVAAAGCALLPLAIHQRDHGGAAFIAQTSFARRVAQIPKQFLVGYHGPLELTLTIVSLLLVAGAFTRLVLAADPPARRRAFTLAALAVAALAATFVFAGAGPDYVLTRNELATWLPLAAATAAGFACVGPLRALGIAGAAVACALGLVVVVGVDANASYQRDDWRGAARALGAAAGQRVVYVSPPSGTLPLSLYLHPVRSMPPGGADVKEIDIVSISPRLPGQSAQPPRPGAVSFQGFTESARTQGATYTVVRERSAALVRIGAQLITSPLDGRPAVPLWQP